MKVAIIHYWLINMRGGEKMLEALLEIYPNADIYTHVYNKNSISNKINAHNIITSYINNLPFSKHLYKIYLPLMPKALIDFNLQSYDLIISSESGPAKGVIPNPNSYHLCYCHTPMRYIWDMYNLYFNSDNFISKYFMTLFISSLRIWDITSANFVDRFVTNSNYVAKRILRIYNRKADVIFGPVQIEKYLCNERNPSDYYLLFGEITPYKRADIAIEACINSSRKLIIAGSGAKKRFINKYKNSNLIVFKGKVSDNEAARLFSEALALLYPGIEDFGLVPIEANASGCPVIAYRDGGVLDTIKENITGLFFNEQSSDSLMETLERFEEANSKGIFSKREVFTEHVKQFSQEVFMEKIARIVAERKRV